MKPSLLAGLYRRLGEGLGLLEDASKPPAFRRPSSADAKRALAAVRRLRDNARKMKLGLSDDDVVRLCKEGRR